MKKVIAFFVLSGFLLLAACSSDESVPCTIVHTTLTKTYVPVTKSDMKGFDVAVGEGEAHQSRTLYDKAKEPSGSFWSLAYLLAMADQHMVDEQSPVRSSFFDTVTVFFGMFEAAFRPQEDLAPHLLNAMVMTANQLNVDYGRNLDMVLSLGDMADNGELAEFAWCFDIMSGNAGGQIAPWTGTMVRDFGPQDYYDPYYRPAFYDSNAPFPIVGLRKYDLSAMPWYSVIGNHDVLNIGNFPVDMPEWPLSNFFFTGEMYTGGLSAFGYLRGLPTLVVNTVNEEDAPAQAFYDRMTFYGNPAMAEAMGRFLSKPKDMEFLVKNASEGMKFIQNDIDTNFDFGQLDAVDPAVTKDAIGIPVVADASREFLGPKRLFEMLRDRGNGCFLSGVEDPDEGYYAMDYATDSGMPVPIRLIFINTDEAPLSAEGGMSKTQWNWLKSQLHTARKEGKLVIVVSHVPSGGILRVPGVCIPGTCGKKFVDLLQSYSNVIAHLAGHTHTNTVTAKPNKRKPESGYWEVVTCSTQVWPQQTRILEVVIYENGVGELWSTMLDHDDTLSSYGPVNQLSGAARGIGLNDYQMDMNDQGVPKNAGKALDRNVILRFDVPKETVEFLQANVAPSTEIQSLTFAKAASYPR